MYKSIHEFFYKISDQYSSKLSKTWKTKEGWEVVTEGDYADTVTEGSVGPCTANKTVEKPGTPDTVGSWINSVVQVLVS